MDEKFFPVYARTDHQTYRPLKPHTFFCMRSPFPNLDPSTVNIVHSVCGRLQKSTLYTFWGCVAVNNDEVILIIACQIQYSIVIKCIGQGFNLTGNNTYGK